MLHRLCGPPSIPLSFILANVLLRRSTYCVNCSTDFNISLHGGEVTTLPKQEFHDLIQYISRYYQDMRELITDAGFRVPRVSLRFDL